MTFILCIDIKFSQNHILKSRIFAFFSDQILYFIDLSEMSNILENLVCVYSNINGILNILNGILAGCAAVVVACFSAAGAVFGATGGKYHLNSSDKLHELFITIK